MDKMQIKNSCVEVIQILEYAPLEVKNKIPYKLLEKIKENASKTHIWKYNKNKKLSEQECSIYTKIILEYIYIKYLNNIK